MNNRFHNKSDDPAVEAHLEDILQTLYSFYDKKIEMSLDRVERFLSKLGNPHIKPPPRGSRLLEQTATDQPVAILKALLEASGKTVHVNDLPTFSPRGQNAIIIAGQPISSQNLITLLEELPCGQQ